MVKVSQMETKRKFMLSAFLATLLLAVGCSEKKPETVAAAPPPAPSVLSSTTAEGLTAVQPKAEETLTVTGPLIVEHQVDVTAQRDGIVASISAEAGARVKAGTILALLDGRQVSANLEAARAKTRSIDADIKNWQAEAEVMQADYVRAQRLWDLKLISEEQLQHAKFKAESEQWDIRRVRELLTTSQEEEHSLELELEKTRISAPFDGVVARRYVRAGQAVAKADRLFWVTAEGPLRMRFTLPEKFVGHLRKGQELALTSPDVPPEKHTAKIKEISPVVDPSSGTIEILAELAGPAGNLRPGMTASVHIDNPR
jgi:membrane fusion protein (multidrug efflux system)